MTYLIILCKSVTEHRLGRIIWGQTSLRNTFLLPPVFLFVRKLSRIHYHIGRLILHNSSVFFFYISNQIILFISTLLSFWEAFILCQCAFEFRCDIFHTLPIYVKVLKRSRLDLLPKSNQTSDFLERLIVWFVYFSASPGPKDLLCSPVLHVV